MLLFFQSALGYFEMIAVWRLGWAIIYSNALLNLLLEMRNFLIPSILLHWQNTLSHCRTKLVPGGLARRNINMTETRREYCTGFTHPCRIQIKFHLQIKFQHWSASRQPHLESTDITQYRISCTETRVTHGRQMQRQKLVLKEPDQFLEPGKGSEIPLKFLFFFFDCVFLPGLWAVAAGSRWRSFGVTGQGPGMYRGLQLLHVPSEKGEQSGGGVAGRLTALALQQLDQEVDVAHGQAQDLVLAQLLLWRMGGDELAELGEGGVDVVLPPTLPRIGEHLPGHGAE